MKSSKLSADDLDLFHQATRLVKPLADPKRQNQDTGKSRPDPLLHAKRLNAEGESTQDNSSADILDSNGNFLLDEFSTEYVQIGYGTDLIRDLKRGKWPVQANLDLHGYTTADALLVLENFISDCINSNLRCVRIIHGKGIGSPSGKAILKQAVRQHLSRLRSVQAWIQAKERDGGSGAVLALVRHKK